MESFFFTFTMVNKIMFQTNRSYSIGKKRFEKIYHIFLAIPQKSYEYKNSNTHSRFNPLAIDHDDQHTAIGPKVILSHN